MRPNGWAERRARRRMGLALYLSRVRSSDLLCVDASTLHKTASSLCFVHAPSMRINSVVLTEQLSFARRASVHAKSRDSPTRNQTCCSVRTGLPSFVVYGACGRLAPRSVLRPSSGPRYCQELGAFGAHNCWGLTTQPERKADKRIADDLRRITVELSGAYAAVRAWHFIPHASAPAIC
jgi:hypothetical protein